MIMELCFDSSLNRFSDFSRRLHMIEVKEISLKSLGGKKCDEFGITLTFFNFFNIFLFFFLLSLVMMRHENLFDVVKKKKRIRSAESTI